MKDGTVKQKVNAARRIFVKQPSKLCLQYLERFVKRNKQLLLICVCPAVIVQEADAHFPFVHAAVHISVYDIVYVACLVNIQNADIMLHVILTRVNPFMPPEAEHLCQPPGRLVIAP